MKILFVTPFVPSSIRPRSLGLINLLDQDHEVILISATWSNKDQRDFESLAIERKISVRMNKISAVVRMALGIFSRRPFQQSYMNSSQLVRTVKFAIKEHDPSVVYLNVLRTAHLANDIQGIPVVIDLDEFRSNYYQQLARSESNIFWRVFAAIESFRMSSVESGIVNRFDKILVSSPVDIASDNSKIHLVRSPNLLEGQESLVERPSKNLVFVGRQNYLANVEAVRWFVQNVWPTVLVEHPDARLDIVGDQPGRAIRELQSASINVTGRVEDVREWYLQARASIVPVTLATGVQMKVIEGMSLGTPTIVTTRVAEGAGIEHGNQCLVADSKEEWIIQICRLFDDVGLSRQLSSRASQWAQENHSSQSVSTALCEALVSIDEKTADC